MVAYMLPSNMKEIVQFITESGTCPFADWFDGLDTRAALKVRVAIARIEAGNLGDVKPVGEGVSERRLTYGPGYRIYFGLDGDTIVVLLTGGTKKRQNKDIETAKTYWAEYKRRKAKGE